MAPNQNRFLGGDTKFNLQKYCRIGIDTDIFDMDLMMEILMANSTRNYFKTSIYIRTKNLFSSYVDGKLVLVSTPGGFSNTL